MLTWRHWGSKENFLFCFGKGLHLFLIAGIIIDVVQERAVDGLLKKKKILDKSCEMWHNTSCVVGA